MLFFSPDRRKNSSLLLLISTYDKNDCRDHHYLKAADLLCDILRQPGCMNVVTNVWNDINVSDPLNWFDENVKICKHIILICTPLGKKNWIKNNTNDLFVMGFQMLKKQRIKEKWFSSNSHDFSVIYFDDDSILCIPDEMIKDNVKHKNVCNNLSSFYNQITNKKLDTSLDIVTELKKAFLSAQMSYNDTKSFSDFTNPATSLLLDKKNAKKLKTFQNCV